MNKNKTISALVMIIASIIGCSVIVFAISKVGETYEAGTHTYATPVIIFAYFLIFFVLGFLAGELWYRNESKK